MRLAAIDIGTNSVHMIVVRVRPDLSFEVIDREKEMVRLGAGGLDGKALTRLGDDARRCRRSRSSSGWRIRTASTRSSPRRPAPRARPRTAATSSRRHASETGIRVRVISGAEEARLIHLAAVYGVDLGGGHGVVIDIGGGSVEITLGTVNRAQLAKSFKIGVIRLTERFVRTDPLLERDERRLVKHINEEIGAHVDRSSRRGFQRVIGTSGTILSLGSVALDSGVRTSVTDESAICACRQAACTRCASSWSTPICRSACRSPASIRAAPISRSPARCCSIRSCAGSAPRTSRSAIWRCAKGSSSTTSAATRRTSHRSISIPTSGGAASRSWAERCNYWSDHARQVARLALALFDQTHGAARPDRREREWLEYGALLHDVGVHISYKSHHKHSYYLIQHGDLRGFDPRRDRGDRA